VSWAVLSLSGTPGLASDGQLPETFARQAEQVWNNIFALLERAGMRTLRNSDHKTHRTDEETENKISLRFLDECFRATLGPDRQPMLGAS
jgi:hypothetical protein